MDLPPPADDLIQLPEPEPEPMEDPVSAIEPPVIEPPLPPPQVIIPKPKPFPKEVKQPKPGKYVQAKQEVLQFEPVTRGRFEKSEPTIVEGQDLDVPTFLRKNFRVK